MGGSFSTVEYREKIISFQNNLIVLDDNTSINDFLSSSEDFNNVITASTIEDYRKIRDAKPDNLVYLISYVRQNYPICILP